MKSLNRVFVLSALACSLVLTGCVKLWQENIDIKTYMVEVNRVGEPMQTALAPKLWIDSVTVLPPFNVRHLILKESDVEYTTSYYSELLISPSENFRNNVYAWFAASGLFDEVSIADRSGMTHRLLVTVMKFHGDREAGQAILKIKVTLIDEMTKGVRVLLSKDYEQHIAVAEFAADDLIRAYNEALTLILANCESDVATLF